MAMKTRRKIDGFASLTMQFLCNEARPRSSLSTGTGLLTYLDFAETSSQSASDRSGAQNPYLNDPEKSKKGEGITETVSPSLIQLRPAFLTGLKG